MMRLVHGMAIAIVIVAMFVAFVAWPALMADGVAAQNGERAYCLKHAHTGEEIRQCG